MSDLFLSFLVGIQVFCITMRFYRTDMICIDIIMRFGVWTISTNIFNRVLDM